MLGDTFWSMAPGLGVTIGGIALVICMKILDAPLQPEEQADITPEQDHRISLGRKAIKVFGFVVAFVGFILAMIPLVERAKQLLASNPAVGSLLFIIAVIPMVALVLGVATRRR